MELKRDLSLPIMIAAILIVPSMIAMEGSEERTRNLIDLAVLDIWHDENMTVSCRIGSLAAPYTGSFYVDLVVDGHPYFMETVIMTDWTGHINITFQQRVHWEGETMEVMVSVFDIQIPEDNDTTNDNRTEVWDRDLPNLQVKSVYVPEPGKSTFATVWNTGFKTANAPFNLTLLLNGTKESEVIIDKDIAPWKDLRVDLKWTWDTGISPLHINVTIDPHDVVDEFDERDNRYFITWEKRPKLFFTELPRVTYTDSSSATIEWSTSQPCRSRMDFGPDLELSRSHSSQGYLKQSSMSPDKLASGTQYLYRITAFDGYGRNITSDIEPFVTSQDEGGNEPTINFSGELDYGWEEEIDIPMEIEDDVGIKKVDLYVNGQLYKSFGGMKKKSISKLALGKPKDMRYLKPDWGKILVTVRVIDEGGKESSYDFPSMTVRKPFEYPFPKIVWNPDTERTYDGSEMLAARCEDPGGVVNATWYIDGVEVEFDENHPPTATYFGPWISWDTTIYDDGLHDITLEVWNNEGNVTSTTRTLEVDNILPPASPDIWVRRGNIERDGSVCTVRLNVTNHGIGDAVNVQVIDRIKGFVPIDGDEGTHPIFGSGKEWEVVLSTPRVRSGQTVWLEYRAIPILYDDEEWVLGYEVPRPDIPSLDYTTSYSYERSDGFVTYSGYTWLPPMNFEDGLIMDAGARQALSSSNYLMITNPVLLLRHMVFGAGYFETLAECGELLAHKNGVFGFIDSTGGGSPPPEDILDTIVDWKELLHPDFEDRGYLAILGEDEIIPAWNYNNVVDSEDVAGSDHGYSNLNGGNTPKLIVGRILGNTPEKLLEPIRVSTRVASGAYRNDNDGNAIIMSGGGDGVRSFQGNADDIHLRIYDDMRSVSLQHVSRHLIIEDGSMEFNGKSRHMDAGDLDGDGSGEVVILNPSDDRVHIYHPDTGTSTDFSLEMTDRAQVKTGWLNYFDRKMFVIFDDFPDGDDYKGFEMDGTQHWSSYTWFDTDDPVAVMDYDTGSFSDNIIIGNSGTDTIFIYTMWMNEVTHFSAADIRSNHRIDSADMDDDGDLDIIVADHHNDKLRVYLNPTWDRVDIHVSGLDYSDGFGAGDFIYQRAGARGEAVVIHSSNGYLEPCWLEWDDEDSEWVGKSSQVYITPASDDCAAAVTHMQGEGGYEEIVLSIGGWADRTLVLDYRNLTRNFQDHIRGIMYNKDLLVFRDHGNQWGWSGLFDSWDLDASPFWASHRPVMIGLVCQSGRYHDAVDSFAQSALRNGAGVYIGSTQNSFRTSNNNAIGFIEDYAEGTPIGIAFRNIERKMVRDSSSLDLPGEHGRYWAYEYNFYGDPAFGTDGSPWAETRSRTQLIESVRGESEYTIGFQEMRMINDTGGQRAWIPGGSELHVQGKPIVPFKTFEFQLKTGETVSSVEIEKDLDWSYNYDMDIPIFNGYLIDTEVEESTEVPTTRDAELPENPLDNYFPGKTLDWEVRDEGGLRYLLVRLYPFQHDSGSGISRRCESWTLHVNTTTIPVDVMDHSGPAGSLQKGDTAEFSTVIAPRGNGGTISISQRIEESGGRSVEAFPSSIIDVNSTTVVLGSWDTEGHHGNYMYILEVRTDTGCLVRSIEMPFFVGSDISLQSIFTVDPESFNETTSINASLIISNEGEDSVEGFYSISLLDNRSVTLEEINGTASIAAGSDEEFEVNFDLSGIALEVLGVKALFISGDLVISEVKLIHHTDTAVSEPEIYTAELLIDHDGEIDEGSDLVIRGNVTRSDGLALDGIPVGAWIGDRNHTASAITDSNGKFEITLMNLTEGNWSLWVQALFGDNILLRGSTLVVYDVPVSDDDDDDIVVDDDDDDDDIVDDDDDTIDDDDDDTDDDVSGDDDDGKENESSYLLPGLILGLIIVVLLVIIVILLVRRSQGSSYLNEE